MSTDYTVSMRSDWKSVCWCYASHVNISFSVSLNYTMPTLDCCTSPIFLNFLFLLLGMILFPHRWLVRSCSDLNQRRSLTVTQIAIKKFFHDLAIEIKGENPRWNNWFRHKFWNGLMDFVNKLQPMLKFVKKINQAVSE